MDGFWIIVIVLGVLSSSLTQPSCPDPVPGTDVVYIPNPENCATFYECRGSTPTLSNCFPGWLFNPAIQDCDLPKNVEKGICELPSKR